MLPADEDLSGLHTVSLDSAEEDTESQETLDEHDDPYNSLLSGSFVPSTSQRMTKQETVRQSVQQWQPCHRQVTPPTGLQVDINEFNTEGYMSCAFPRLFPTGAADFLALRSVAVTIGDYQKHLMMYKDGWFAKILDSLLCIQY